MEGLAAALALLTLLQGVQSRCNWTAAAGCDSHLTVDPRATFSRDGRDKCRLVKYYYYCLLLEGDCQDSEVRPKLLAYLDTFKLVCAGLNGDQDQFQHGCRELEMLKCEAHLQEKVSELMDLQPEAELALCAALDWSQRCMVENASCHRDFVDAAVNESKLRLGEHACSCTPSWTPSHHCTLALLFLALLRRTT